jgi:hypothetical protein
VLKFEVISLLLPIRPCHRYTKFGTLVEGLAAFCPDRPEIPKRHLRILNVTSQRV